MNLLKNFLKRKKYNRKDTNKTFTLYALWQKNKSFVLHGVFVPCGKKIFTPYQQKIKYTLCPFV